MKVKPRLRVPLRHSCCQYGGASTPKGLVGEFIRFHYGRMTVFSGCVILRCTDARWWCLFCAALHYDVGDFTAGGACLRLAGAALTRIDMGCVGEIWWLLLISPTSGPGQRFGGHRFQSCCSINASKEASLSPIVGATGQPGASRPGDAWRWRPSPMAAAEPSLDRRLYTGLNKDAADGGDVFRWQRCLWRG